MCYISKCKKRNFILSAMLILILLCLTSSVNATAVSVLLGDKMIEIPEPNGFILVTPEMDNLSNISKHFNSIGYELLAMFITMDDASIAKAGGSPSYNKYFTVSIQEHMKYFKSSNADFEAFKNMLREINVSSDKELISKTTGYIDDKIIDSFGIENDSTASDITVLPTHLDSENMLSYSFYIKYIEDSQTDDKRTMVEAVTSTFIHVKSKVLLISCRSPDNELRWSQEQSKMLAESILTASYSLPDISKSVKPTNVTPFTEIQVLIGIIIGVLGVVLIWAIILVCKKIFPKN